MGLSDRDYMRPGGASRAGGWGAVRALSVWSVTTWLIVICTGVFVLDSLLGSDWVLVRGPILPVNFDEDPHNDVDLRNVEYVGSDEKLPPTVVQVRVPVVDQATGALVGYGDFARMHLLTKYLHFSTALGFLNIEYWRLIGFQFLHSNLMHLVMNMIGLFFFGPLVEEFLGRKRFLAFYLLAGIFGALMYLLLNLAGVIAVELGTTEPIPGLIFNDPKTPLVGASAGVFGVIMAGAYIAPRDVVYVFGMVPVRLPWFAYGLVVLAAFTVITGGYNAGGEAGHLGGAIAGFYFIRRPHHLHGFFDVLGRVDPTSHHYRKGAPVRVVRPRSTPDQVDRILDKIARSGLDSLTPEEQRILSDDARRRG